MLMDKGFYDYDYKVIEIKREVSVDDLPNYDETQKILAGFGFGIYAKKDKSKPVSDMNIEELQEYAIKQLNEK